MIDALHVAPASVGAPAVPEAPSLHELAEHDGAAVPVQDDGEPLVEVDDIVDCLNLYRIDGWAGVPERTWLRAEVAERLRFARSLLPDGFSFAVFDGWRSAVTIRALYDHFYGPGSTLAPGFLANPDDPAVIPPHQTGAAVDLTLAWEGTPLALGTHFDDFTPRAWVHALELGPEREPEPGQPAEPDRSLRRLLHASMRAGGFVGMREEWWHFSFGDQRWAQAQGLPVARYGPVAPPLPC